ncbi:hypothetical protein [Herbaspirillum sp. VT-16-41]|uniref:hypothetical protein n=1 Tax=Herbaspirillum sp. VT-16-41 TaxID=1953765 RepID=UPI0009814C7C|nr:hypothetical protein [Herbaspirillum sp. VT-16-41]ONN66654.1 hypothetical protein BTM36_08890 [Herbaspirillum sp. VT-16-41]
MKIYWSLKQIPELSCLDRRQRLARWRGVSLRLFHHWQTWLGLLACALLAGLGRSIGMGYPGSIAGALVGAQCYWHACVYVARRHYRRLLAHGDEDGADTLPARDPHQ